MQASRFAPIGLLLFCAACTAPTTGDMQASAAPVASAQEIPGTTAKPGDKGGEDETGPYEVVPNWPDPTMCGAGYQQGSVSGVWAETPDRIFVFQRGCLPALPPARGGGPGNLAPARNASGFSLAAPKENWPRWDHVLFVVNREGKLVESWDQWSKLFVRTHRVVISPYDPDRNVWIIDDGAHSVYKFSHDGKKLLLTLGEFRVAANDEKHFGRPTDIAFLPDGTFFISDGYENTRVVKFDKDGKFLMTWGEPSDKTPGAGQDTRPNHFNTVHGIAIDNQRRVYVDDRANSRIQIFDENGKFLEQWMNTRLPYYIYMSNDQHLWISDGATNKIAKYDLTGRLLYSWGSFGTWPGGFWGVHQFSVDSENNLYTADVHIGRLQKFRPKAGVDPRQLIGQRVVAGSSTN